MNVNPLENIGGPPPQLDVVSAFRSTLPSLPELSNEQIQRISKAVMSKFPGIAASVVTTIVPIIAPMVLKQVMDLEKDDMTANVANVALALGTGIYFNLFHTFLTRQILRESDLYNHSEMDRTKLRALRNWEVGSTLGYISSSVVLMSQLFESSHNLMACLGSLMAGIAGIVSIPSKELVKNNKEDKVIALMRQNIEEAIDKGLLEKDNVIELLCLHGTQNMILFNSLTQISTNKFAKLYSKFFLEPPMMIEGNYITKDFIDNLKNRINQLSSKDQEFLQVKLALLEKEDEKAENEEEVSDIFRIISAIGMRIWHIYQFELKSSIKDLDPDHVDTIYDKIINFLAEK